MPNICILDAKTLGEDCDLSTVEQFGKVHVYQTTQPGEVIPRIKDQEIIITNKVVLNAANLKYAENLKLICVTATGTNNIDLDYAGSRNIAVCNVAGYSTDSVVQHTFALLFYLLESLAYYDHYVKSQQYAHSDIFTHLNRAFWELKGKTWGIIGLGTIGSRVAAIAESFGCHIVYYSTSGKNNHRQYRRLELNTLLKTADVISIHAPLNQQTYHLIGLDELRQMQKHAILLNLGRGGIVHESDLAQALDDGLIAAAGLDVLEKEPLEESNPLLKIKHSRNLIITPHIAWASKEARTTLLQEVALNIEAFLNGRSRNRV